MSTSKKPRINIKEQLGGSLHRLGKYKVILFLVFVVAVYGFVAYEINADNNVQPSTSEVNAQTSPVASAHIDKAVVSQLQKLQDNDVSVKTLFQQARNNPFQD